MREHTMPALTGIMAIFTALSVWGLRNTLKRRGARHCSGSLSRPYVRATYPRNE